MNPACTLVVLATFLPATVLAGPQVTPQDIIDHFTAGQADAAGTAQRTRSIVTPGAKGQDRGVFIGAAGFGDDADADDAASAPPPDPGAYDLLVEFDLDSAALRAEARRHLDAFIEALQNPALSGHRFLVEGHTDASGPADYNLELSRRRAVAVVEYLVERGIEAERLLARGFGETRPRTSDPGDRANRRVETRLSQ